MHSANQISLSLLFTTKMWRWHQAKPWFLLVSSPLARAASRHLGVPGGGGRGWVRGRGWAPCTFAAYV